MAEFPLLKTGGAVQYPLHVSTRFKTEAVKFLDGSQQKYRLFRAGYRRWTIKLDLLDEAELAALNAFLEAQGSAPFAFTDPGSGVSAARCVIGDDRFKAGSRGEMMGDAEVMIEEIP